MCTKFLQDFCKPLELSPSTLSFAHSSISIFVSDTLKQGTSLSHLYPVITYARMYARTK